MLGGLGSQLLKHTAIYALLLCAVLACLVAYDVLSEVLDVRYVATGSMEPYFPRGSIVLVYKDATAVAIGDPVAYRYPQSPRVTLFHRVVEMNGDQVYVKGDAVDNVEKVKLRNIDGVYLFGVPYVMSFAMTLFSDLLLAHILLAFILVSVLLDLCGSGGDRVDR